ncbi:hypothetical protein ACKWTF_007150 [Chironomus riparius]
MESVRVILIAILMIIVCLYNNADAKPTPMPQFPFTVTTKRNPVPWRDRNDAFFDSLDAIIWLKKKLISSLVPKRACCSESVVVYDPPFYPVEPYYESFKK